MPRARQACLRCRKQKLRCDDTRPCALCVRVGVECEERPENKEPHKPLERREHLAHKAPLSPGAYHGSPEHGTPPKSRERQASEVYKERTSTYEVVDQLLKEHHSTARLTHAVAAIPGGSPDARLHEAGVQFLSVQEVLGFDLPPTHVLEFCLQSYLDAVHWFMLLFHEPSFRAELQDVSRLGVVRGKYRALLSAHRPKPVRHYQCHLLDFLVIISFPSPLVVLFFANTRQLIDLTILRLCPTIARVNLQTNTPTADQLSFIILVIVVIGKLLTAL
jgi:hypothetical protein